MQESSFLLEAFAPHQAPCSLWRQWDSAMPNLSDVQNAAFFFLSPTNLLKN
jgi:hypothetical protein